MIIVDVVRMVYDLNDWIMADNLRSYKMLKKPECDLSIFFVPLQKNS